LQLAVNAILQGDLAKVLSQVQKSIDIAEHQCFVEQLAAKR
jgi:hypothetical protein